MVTIVEPSRASETFRWSDVTDAKTRVLDSICERMRAEVSIKDRKWLGLTYKQCLNAPEILDWLESSGFCDSRKDALEIGRALQKKKYIIHVWGSHTQIAPLSDTNMYFRYTPRGEAAEASDTSFTRMSFGERSRIESETGNGEASKSRAGTSHTDGLKRPSEKSTASARSAISVLMKRSSITSKTTRADTDPCPQTVGHDGEHLPEENVPDIDCIDVDTDHARLESLRHSHLARIEELMRQKQEAEGSALESEEKVRRLGKQRGAVCYNSENADRENAQGALAAEEAETITAMLLRQQINGLLSQLNRERELVKELEHKLGSVEGGDQNADGEAQTEKLPSAIDRHAELMEATANANTKLGSTFRSRAFTLQSNDESILTCSFCTLTTVPGSDAAPVVVDLTQFRADAHKGAA